MLNGYLRQHKKRLEMNSGEPCDDCEVKPCDDCEVKP